MAVLAWLVFGAGKSATLDETTVVVVVAARRILAKALGVETSTRRAKILSEETRPLRGTVIQMSDDFHLTVVAERYRTFPASWP